MPPQQWLAVVYTHPTLWGWTSALFLSGTLVTLLGFALLARLLEGAGDRGFSYLGLIALLFGAVFWVIVLGFRLSIDPWAAQETARTGVMPDFYVPLSQWTLPLFVVCTILTFLGAAAYGGALVSTRLLPHGLGWVTIVYSLAALGLVVAFGNAPPLLHYLLPIAMGILLLLQRDPLPRANRHKQALAVAATSAVE